MRARTTDSKRKGIAFNTAKLLQGFRYYHREQFQVCFLWRSKSTRNSTYPSCLESIIVLFVGMLTG